MIIRVLQVPEAVGQGREAPCQPQSFSDKVEIRNGQIIRIN